MRDERHELTRNALHLFVLCAFAIAEPIYDVLGRAPEFFVARSSTRLEIIVFALGILLIPPALLLIVEAMAAVVSRRAGRLVHLLLVGLLVALFALQAVKREGDLSATAIFTAAGVAGVLGALLYARVRPVRLFASVLGVAPLVFLAIFLVRSPVAKLEDTAHALPLPKPRTATPVVLIVMDEFPVMSLMDHRHLVDPVRFPHFAALARDSVWFRNATSVHEHTTEAVPAIFTGQYPKVNALPLVADHPGNVFTLLGSRYRMHVFEPVTQLCPQRLCRRDHLPFAARLQALTKDLEIVYGHLVLPKSMEKRLPSVANTWQDFGGDTHGLGGAGIRTPLVVANAGDIDAEVGRQMWQDQRFQFERFVVGIGPSPATAQKPVLNVMHILLPHYPWRFLPSGKQYANSLGIDGLDIDTWQKDPWLVAQGWQRHLLQVGTSDALLGDLVRRLKREGIYDRALLVVVADHGVSFIPGEHRRSITAGNIPDISSVPLFVKFPGEKRGRVDDRDVQTIDIVPTIADVLGVHVPYHVDGHSLAQGGVDRTKVAVHERGGGEVTASNASVHRRKYETLRRQLALFGEGSWRRVYDVGPHHDLIGRAVESLPNGTAKGAHVLLDGASLFRTVDLGSALSPGHVTGRVVGLPRGPTDLAVAVNGVVAAVTQTFDLEGDVRFAALAPDSAFRNGANDVEIFVVRGGRLERLVGGTGGGQRYALAGASLTRGGRALRLVPGGFRGRVEDWFYDPSTVRIGGWAADLRGKRLPDEIVVFRDGRFFFSGATTVERRNLSAAYGPKVAQAGFVFDLPRTALGTGGHRLRFFAVKGDEATELRYPKDFPWRSSR